MSNAEDTPKNLDEFFESTGLKAKFMARKWDIAPSYLSKIRTGERTPSKQLARKMHQDTGVPLETLLYGEPAAPAA